MGLSVTVLGCSGSYPGPGGACSGYLLDDGTTRIWLDAGSGTMANLQRHIGVEQLDAIVLSHEHPDHWSDLEGWRIVWRYRLERVTGFPVYAPAGLRARTYEPESPALAWHDVTSGDKVTVGTMDFTFSRTDHGPETLGMRVDAGGRSLGYSADTGPAWSLEALGPGLDLALCEATMTTEEEGTLQHLSARQAGATARAAGAGRLVLTHLWSEHDPEQSRREGSEAFGGPVEVAIVDARYDV
ncbi:MAG TPA: MBL fold metallo-hydrolase [Acidimicrobiales bacterium]|nr:MBL fold metallo-hydrolase [Acidimicrobiales bacterium]